MTTTISGLELLLQSCTVKVTHPGLSGWGTGFFVAPGLVMTCAHVVRGAKDKQVKVHWPKATLDYAAETLKIADDRKTLDVALIKLESSFPIHPCVYLDEAIHDNEQDLRPGDSLFSYGYLQNYENAAGVVGVSEWYTGDTPPLIKFQGGEIQAGISGAALLNLRTGKVIGIVKETRSANFPIGGGAVPITTAYQHVRDVVDLPRLQQEFHSSNLQWINQLPSEQGGWSPGNQLTNIPRSGAIEFLGRNDQIYEVTQAFESTNRVVITGMGGVGKTELAIQYATRFLNSFSSICWIDARAKDIANQIIQYAKIYFDFEKIIPDLDLEGQLEFCWGNWPTAKNLIIFDDVKTYQDIESLLPPDQPEFKVLITSRSNQLGQARTAYVELGIFDESKSLELLRSITGKDFINENIDTAKQICYLLGYLPLGLELISRYLKSKIGKRKISLLQIKKRLESEGLKSKLTLETSQDMTARRGLYSAFQISWEELEKEARYIAFVMSIFALAPVTKELLSSCISDIDDYLLEDILDESLIDSHLLNHKNGSTYELHHLIREFISGKDVDIELEKAEECKRLVSNCLVQQARQIPESITKEDILEFGHVIPHLIEVTQKLLSFTDNQNVFSLYQGLGRYYEGQGFYARAEEIYSEAQKVIETKFGFADTNTLKASIHLAAIYYEQGRYREAEELQRSLLNHSDSLDSDQLVHADILNGLGLTLVEQGQYAEAENLYNLSIQIRLKALGDQHVDVSDSFNNLGLLYNDTGDYLKAESLFLKSLNIRQKFFGEGHVRVANCLNNLASCYYLQKKYEDAKNIYVRVLDIYTNIYGEEHRELATVLNNLSVVYLQEKQFSDAELALEKVIALQEKMLGKNHPDIAISISNLATLYGDLGKFEQAEATYKQALEIQRMSLEPYHPDIGITLNNLAKVYQSAQRYIDAEESYASSVEILSKTLDSEHPNLHKVRINLELLREQIKSMQNESNEKAR